MSAPNLDDPVERAAYKLELSRIGTGIRRAGLAIALVGTVLVLLEKRGLFHVPMVVGATVIGAGVMLMISGLQARNRYHQLRMRG